MTFNSVAGMTTYAWTDKIHFQEVHKIQIISNVSALANGTYTLTVTNAGGCTASATTAVTINALPRVQIQVRILQNVWERP
ncbi:MAG: hypothetical protein U5N85_00235 [Arcicella sp.]|nr:hypothetical protein [Arcicella sp.]